MEVFDYDKSEELPPFKHTNYKIDIIEGKEVLFGPLYNLSERERPILREYLQTNPTNGRIQHSTSPAGAPILFVLKKDGSLRLCVDYRGLNAVIVKDRTAILLINKTLDRLLGAHYYTSLHIKDAYHRIRVRDGDQ